MTSLATLLSLAGEARGGRLHQADAGRCHVSGFGCHADDWRGQDNARQPLTRRLWSRPGCKVRSHALSFLKSGGRVFFSSGVWRLRVRTRFCPHALRCCGFVDTPCLYPSPPRGPLSSACCRYRESVNTALRSLLIALKAARDAKMNGSKMM